ncbi:MAG: hypothetical protein KJ915_04030 [Candidatus Omnitrophica bacterium]|nr:hypothetical protein [Candidatus Omnitrophota bacterium]
MRKFILIFKTIFVLLVFLTTFSFAANDTGINQENVKEKLVGHKAMFTDDGFFNVYYDYRNILNHHFPSGWMGDYGDIGMDEKWEDNPQSGETCMKWTYSAQGKQGAGYAGSYWQRPHGDWGSYKDGFDLRQAKRLTFWARGEHGNEKIKFQIGGLGGKYPDSDKKISEVLTLSRDWQQFSLNLEGLELSYIDGIFFWLVEKEMSPNGCVFYLDNIRYEK